MRVLTPVLFGAFFLASGSSLFAQTVAVPPSEAVLDRANLKTVWTTAIPIAGRQDGISLIQVASGGQVFVQTKGGQLLALDSKTGNQQWAFKFISKDTPTFPVAYNERYVLAVNLVTLYCLHRYSGLVEFQMQLPLVPSAAPAIDRNTVYVTMNGIRVTAYELPEGLTMPEKRAKVAALGVPPADRAVKNPVDTLVKRYPSTSRNITNAAADQFESKTVTLDSNQQTGGATGSQRSPSLSILPTVRPPYSVFDDRGRYILRSESLSTVHSMRQPYALQDPTQAHIQRTPSIASIPPSLAAVYEQSSLLPRPFQPRNRWIFGSTVRVTYTPLTTSFRVWLAGDSQIVQALLQDDRASQITARMPNVPSAQPSQGDDIGYFPLVDGNLLAIDLTGGVGPSLKQVWRSNVGGAMNRSPLVTFDAVYQGGDASGVARVDRKSGDVVWRTDESADRVLAVNDEVVYVRDRSGILRVYDRNRIQDTTTKRAILLASADLSTFNVPTTNERTDRIFLGADSGMLICLRDKSAKYAAPITVGPPASKPDPSLTKKVRSDGGITSVDAPPPEAKKEEPKKDEPKKDEPKK